MPAWLERAAPRISIEGEEYFAERDAAAAAAAAAEGARPAAASPSPTP
jgi:hypothetical protein